MSGPLPRQVRCFVRSIASSGPLPRVATVAALVVLVGGGWALLPLIGVEQHPFAQAETQTGTLDTSNAPPPPATSPPPPPTSAEYRSWAKTLPQCAPGETSRPSPYPNVSGCRLAGPAPTTPTFPARYAARKLARQLPGLVPVAYASDLGIITAPVHRHNPYSRASVGTGEGRDTQQWNFPQYGTGGDNYGTDASILAVNPSLGNTCVPPGAPCLAMASVINFFDAHYLQFNNAGLDEVGWVKFEGAGYIDGCDDQIRPFTDDGAGHFHCAPITLTPNTWYYFLTQSLGGNTWGNSIYLNNTWTQIDTRPGPDASSGIDPGTEAWGVTSAYTTGVAGMAQYRSLGGSFQSVGSNAALYPCTNQPLGHACAYTIQDSPLIISTPLVNEHQQWWMGMP